LPRNCYVDFPSRAVRETSFSCKKIFSILDSCWWDCLLLNWPPWYNWNIVESGINHHNPLTLY
jgi:hypothetical protein